MSLSRFFSSLSSSSSNNNRPKSNDLNSLIEKKDARYKEKFVTRAVASPTLPTSPTSQYSSSTSTSSAQRAPSRLEIEGSFARRQTNDYSVYALYHNYDALGRPLQ